MATDFNEFDDNDFNLGDEFGLDDDFGFGDVAPPPDDRKPITVLRDGVKEGAKDWLRDENNIREFGQKALPKGYNSALDDGLVLKNNIQRNLGMATSEIRKEIVGLKRVANRLTPSIEKALGSKIAAKFDKLTQTKESGFGPNTDEENDNVKLAMQEVFGEMMEAQHANQRQIVEEQTTKDAIRDKIANEQNTIATKQRGESANYLSQIANYFQQIDFRWKRTSLDLQVRMHFLTKRQLEITTQGFGALLHEAKAITKNTGLPDVAKLRATETFHQMATEKLVGKVQDRASTMSRNYFKNMLGNFGEATKEKTAEIVEAISMVKDMVDQAADMIQMQNEMDEMGGGPPMDPKKKAIELVGSQIAGMALSATAKAAAKKFLAFMESRPNLVARGENLKYISENKGAVIDSFIKEYEDKQGAKGMLAKVLKTFAPTIGGKRETITNSLKDDPMYPVNWDLQSRRTLVEVIPGWFAKLDQSLRSLVTGNKEKERTFDWHSEQFKTREEAGKRALEDVVGKKTVETIASEVERLMGILDPDKKLSKKAANTLRRSLIQASDESFGFHLSDYTTGRRINSDDPRVTAEITKFFQDTFSVGENGILGSENGVENTRHRNRAAEQFKKLQDALPDTQEAINRYQLLGDKESLRKAGIVKDNEDGQDSIDHDYLYGLMSGDTAKFKAEDGTKPRRRRGGGPTPPPGTNKDYTKPLNRITGVLFDIRNLIRTISGKMGTPPGPTPPTPPGGGPGSGGGDKRVDLSDKTHERLVSDLTTLIETHNRSFRDDLEVARNETRTYQSKVIELLEKAKCECKDYTPHLSDIKLLLIDIVNRTGGNGGGGPGPGGPGGGGDSRRWWELTIGEMSTKIMGGLTDAAKKPYRMARFAWLKGKRLARRFIDVPGNILSTLNRAKTGALNAGKKFLKQYQDIYLVGGTEPILYGRDLRNDYYYDLTTHKRIVSIDDITGPVIDKHGQYVITQVDFDHGLEIRTPGLASRIGGRLTTAILGALSLPKNIIGAVIKQGKRVAQFGLDVVQGAVGGVKSYFDKACDVYLNGERTPRLLKSIMENGGYFDAAGNVVKRLKDIKGDIYDAAGNIVLTAEEAKNDLFVNIRGKFTKLKLDMDVRSWGNKAGEAIGKIVKAPFKLFGKTMDFFKKGLEHNALKKLFLKLPDDIILRANVVNVISGDGRKTNDSDGDGLRDGSWQDILKRRKERAKEKADQTRNNNGENSNEKKGLLGLLGGLFGGAMDKFKSIKESLTDWFGGEDIDLPDGERRDRRGRRGRPPRGGKPGLLRRAGGGLVRGGRAVAGLAIRGAITAAPIIVSGASAVLSGAATLASAALGFVSTPIVAGALAVLSVGYIGWKLWGYFKRRGDVGKLEALRFIQYGIDHTNESCLVAVRYLEGELSGKIKTVGKGIDITIPATELFDDYGGDFGLNTDDEIQRSSWCYWYNYRFKPVFLTWTALCSGYKDNDNDAVNINNPDDIPDDKKVEFAEKTLSGSEAPTDPYMVAQSPFEGLPIIANREKVMGYIAELRKLFGATKPVVVKKTTDTPKKQTRDETPKSLTPPLPNNVVSLNTQRTTPNVNTNTDFGTYTQAPSALIFSIHQKRKAADTTKPLTAIEKVRFYQYGANIANPTHVASLFALENELFSQITTGEGGKFTLRISINKLFDKMAGSFGLNALNDDHKLQWTRWFELRFLPCYLKLYQLVTQTTGSNNTLSTYQSKLTVFEQLDFLHAQIANRLDTATGWVPFTIPYSPWGAGYEVPMDIAYFQSFVASVVDELQVKGNIGDDQVQKIERVRAEKFAQRAKQVGGEQNAVMPDGKLAINQFNVDRRKPQTDSRWYDMFAGGNSAKSSSIVPEGGSYNASKTGVLFGSGGGLSGVLPKSNIVAKPPRKGPGKDAGEKALLLAAKKYGVTDPKELAALLAQVAVESGDYRATEENLRYRAGQLLKVFPKYVRNFAEAEALAKAGPVAIANRVYGGRMGNTDPDDGYNFRGRGFIQLTGKDNYRAFAKHTGIDVVNNPERREWLSSPEGAAESALVYWTKINPQLRKYGQGGDIVNVSSLVNSGGLYTPGKQVNHMNERQGYYQHYLKELESGRLSLDNLEGPGPAQVAQDGSGNTNAPTIAVNASKSVTDPSKAMPGLGSGNVPGTNTTQSTNAPRVAAPTMLTPVSNTTTSETPTTPTVKTEAAYQQQAVSENVSVKSGAYEERTLQIQQGQLTALTSIQTTLSRIESLMLESGGVVTPTSPAKPTTQTVSAETGPTPVDFNKRRA